MLENLNTYNYMEEVIKTKMLFDRNTAWYIMSLLYDWYSRQPPPVSSLQGIYVTLKAVYVA